MGARGAASLVALTDRQVGNNRTACADSTRVDVCECLAREVCTTDAVHRRGLQRTESGCVGEEVCKRTQHARR